MNPLFQQPPIQPQQTPGFQVAPMMAPGQMPVPSANPNVVDPAAPQMQQAANTQQINPYNTPGEINPPPIPLPKKEDIVRQMDQGSDYAAKHEPVRIMAHNMMDAFQSPEAVAFQKSTPGIDWDSIHTGVDETRSKLKDMTPDTSYVNDYGTANAVKTAFKGGSYMDIAASMLGKSEGKDHEVISSFIEKSMGQKIDPRQTPWCAAYVNSVLQAGGIQGTSSLAARSFLKFGTEVKKDDASKGDVVVFGRGDPSHGHVGFIDHISSDGKTVYVLGGNQSNAVTVSARPTAQILGIRRPPSPDEIQKHTEEVGMQRVKERNAAPAPMPSAEPAPQVLSPLLADEPNVKYT